MDSFTQSYADAAMTALGFFWKALWAFVLGYVISSMIQVFVTRQRMRDTMGEPGAKSVGLGTFFGFISSSCSFAALATAKSIFKKGAGLIPSLAFLLASTNLVIELGIVIAIFLGWQFVVAEYVGGILLILFTWILVKLTYPKKLIEKVQHKLQDEGDEKSMGEDMSWKEKMTSREGWQKVAQTYFMEWGMVWRDVTIGFTIAGVIAAFVPDSFFQALFIGAGEGESPGFWAVLEHAVVGPVAAFFTFIGSMGNIPLAAVLFGSGVSFAGVMAFIFSDLIVFPMLRITAEYFGWKLAFYIVGVFFAAAVSTALVLHYGFKLAGVLPEQAEGKSPADDAFAIDYTFWLNLAFLAVTGIFFWLRHQARKDGEGGGMEMGEDTLKKVLRYIAYACYLWLAGGLVAHFAAG